MIRQYTRLRVADNTGARELMCITVIGRSSSDTAEVGDQAAESLGQRHATGLDADERDARKVAVPFDDLVSDAGDRPVQRLRIQQNAPSIDMRSHKQLLSGLSGPS